jgi:hypothetical protein
MKVTCHSPDERTLGSSGFEQVTIRMDIIISGSNFISKKEHGLENSKDYIAFPVL